jgi:DNA polymerase V
MAKGKAPRCGRQPQSRSLGLRRADAGRACKKISPSEPIEPIDHGLCIRQIFSAQVKTRSRCSLYQQPVAAGFPSPAEDHIDSRLDLNRHYIKNPAATFYVRVDGNSMIGAGIHSGDLLIVDRSIEPVPGKVVIAVINGEHTVKRLQREGDCILLVAENIDYAPIVVSELQELHIWGVVTEVIHSL